MSKSTLFYKVQLSLQRGLFTGMNNEDYMRLFRANTVIHHCDDKAIN